MKRKFDLSVENKHPDRVLESIKYEVRKYIKREKNKQLPEGIDFWKIECKFSKNDEALNDVKFEDITKLINEASIEKCHNINIELVSTPGHKKPKKVEIVEEDEAQLGE